MNIENCIKKRESHYFNQGYARVVLYLNNHTDANEAKNIICEDGFNLGTWFLYFRGKWRNGELDSKTVYRMELVGITLVDAEEGFRLMLQKYLDYVEEYKNNIVPQNYKTEDGSMLGAWVCRQKLYYQSMPKEKQKILKEAGII